MPVKNKKLKGNAGPLDGLGAYRKPFLLIQAAFFFLLLPAPLLHHQSQE